MAILAKDGGPKIRTQPWPQIGKRFGKEELRQVKEALDQNTLFYHYGQKTKTLCAAMAKICGAQYVLGCSSGSAAIHGAVKAVGVGPGDEVITSPVTDAGTLIGIVYEGAIPIFADIDPTAYNITADSIRQRITPRTRAVIVVHLGGSPADMPAILRLCRSKKIKVIEDCAQAWGAMLKGKWVGTFGDIGCFSLNDFKHISVGDGGLIVTDDKALYDRAWLCIDKAYDRVNKTRTLDFAAPNYRIGELQSAVGIAQLAKLPGIARKRHALGDRLSRGLSKIKGVTPYRVIPGGYCTYYGYLMRIVPRALGVDLAAFQQALVAEGIPCSAGGAQPVYLQYNYLRNRTAFNHSRWPFSAAKKQPDYRRGICPNAESYAEETIGFGIHERMSVRDIDDTIAAVRKVADFYRTRRS